MPKEPSKVSSTRVRLAKLKAIQLKTKHKALKAEIEAIRLGADMTEMDDDDDDEEDDDDDDDDDVDDDEPDVDVDQEPSPSHPPPVASSSSSQLDQLTTLRDALTVANNRLSDYEQQLNAAKSLPRGEKAQATKAAKEKVAKWKAQAKSAADNIQSFVLSMPLPSPAALPPRAPARVPKATVPQPKTTVPQPKTIVPQPKATIPESKATVPDKDPFSEEEFDGELDPFSRSMVLPVVTKKKRKGTNKEKATPLVKDAKAETPRKRGRPVRAAGIKSSSSTAAMMSSPPVAGEGSELSRFLSSLSP